MSRPRVHKSLTVNAASLMTATVATNALGLVYWTVAAHLVPPAVVGRATATIAAITLLSTIAQLNLTNVFIRLLPAAGRLGRGLITRGYTSVIGLAAVVVSIYLATGLGSRLVPGTATAQLAFGLAVIVLALFALQDSVLTGLRLATWVPIENISFAASKIALLPLLAVVVSSQGGIVVSWVLPAGVAVIAVSGLLFQRVLPTLDGLDGTLPKRRRLLSFVAGEYVSNLCAMAMIQLMPLLVLSQLGATQAAFFALPWLISIGVTVLMWNVAGAFEVELLGEHGRPRSLVRRMIGLWVAVVAVTVALCVLGAEPLLALAGPRYAAGGAGLLRLIGLATPFYAVVALYSTLAWLDQRVWLLAGFQALISALTIGAAVLLMPTLGVEAVGWANLVTQALAAAVLGPLAVRRLRRGVVEGMP
jgi:O-antigen/teichoic acid export membrane protein